MPIKYQCPKCQRRFAEWGAEKLGFKCPKDDLCPPLKEDDNFELVRLGSTEETTIKRPSVKRKAKRPVREVVAVPAPEEVEEEPVADDVVDTDDDAGDDDDAGLEVAAADVADDRPDASEASSKGGDAVEGSVDEIDDDDDDESEMPEDLDFEAKPKAGGEENPAEGFDD